MPEKKEKMLDLSREYCHVCGGQLTRDLETAKEKCTNLGCSARNVEFSIPVVDDPVIEKMEESY